MEKVLRALIIDDEEVVRQLFGMYLGRNGYEVLEAENGVVGLALLRQSLPVDVVLVDWTMPEMNGLAFLQAVRADPALAKVSVLLVTGDGNPAQKDQARAAGADGVLVKPVTNRVLMDKIKALGTGVDSW
ncbi:MAG: response regulator [Elusimicrobia bacterium]|nr:response regulator [Elusimicrobiota bacterium]